jgi:hypothetical protein
MRPVGDDDGHRERDGNRPYHKDFGKGCSTLVTVFGGARRRVGSLLLVLPVCHVIQLADGEAKPAGVLTAVRAWPEGASVQRQAEHVGARPQP